MEKTLACHARDEGIVTPTGRQFNIMENIVMVKTSDLAKQASNEQIEAALKNAVNTFVVEKTVPNKPALSTDPLPPDHHIELIDHIADVVSYIEEEVQKHRTLINLIESLQGRLDSAKNEIAKKSGFPPDPRVINRPLFEEKKKRFSREQISEIVLASAVAIIAVGVIIAMVMYEHLI